MGEKVCLDTDVCIDILNSQPRVEALRNVILDAKIFIASITVFELYLRVTNMDKINNFLKNSDIISFDGNCAIQASDIYKELKSKGRLMEFRDIFIASSALANNCALATFNVRHFSNIKNLQLLKF